MLFQSEMPLWQIPKSTYKQLAVTLAELQYKVRPCGAAGRYLFDHIDAYNRKMGCEAIWPHGETWGLGDNAAISVLLEEEEKISYNMIPAPRVEAGSMRYLAGGDVRPGPRVPPCGRAADAGGLLCQAGHLLRRPQLRRRTVERFTSSVDISTFTGGRMGSANSRSS